MEKLILLRHIVDQTGATEKYRLSVGISELLADLVIGKGQTVIPVEFIKDKDECIAYAYYASLVFHFYGKKDKAIQCYEDAVNQGISESIMDLAKYYEKIGQHDQVIATFNRAKELGIKDVFRMIGYYYYRIHKFTEMKIYFKKSIKNNDVRAMMFMASYYQQKQLFDKMNKYYVMGAEHDCTLAILLYCRYQIEQLMIGKLPDSIHSNIKKFLHKSLDNTDANVLLIIYYSIVGNTNVKRAFKEYITKLEKNLLVEPIDLNFIGVSLMSFFLEKGFDLGYYLKINPNTGCLEISYQK